MPDFAMSMAIHAMDKLSSVFMNMGNAVGKFGSKAGAGFDQASTKASLFKKVLGANIIGNLATDAIRRVGHELAQLPKLIEDFAGRGDQIARTASIVGTTADAWQRLSYAAKITDTSTESLQGAMEKLNKNMSDLSVGKGTLMDIVKYGPPGLGKMIGSTHSATEAFLTISEAIAKTGDAQVRAGIAQAAFGKGGQELIPLLEQGRAGIERLMREAGVYGTVMTDEAIRASERFDETLKKLKGTVGAVKDQVLGFVVEAVTPWTEKARDWISANKELIATKIQDFIIKASEAITTAIPIIERVWSKVSWLINHKDVIVEMYFTWKVAQIALNLAMHANPIGIVVLALEALIAVVVVVVMHWKEITADVRASWEELKGFAEGIWNTVIPYVKALGGTIIKSLLLPVNLVIDAIVGLLTLVGKIPGVGKPFKEVAASVAGFQDKMNAALTGSANPLGFGEIWQNAGAQSAAARAPAQAPNAGARTQVSVTVPVNVDNSRAPGTTSRVRQPPPITGASGSQYAGGGAH